MSPCIRGYLSPMASNVYSKQEDGNSGIDVQHALGEQREQCT